MLTSIILCIIPALFILYPNYIPFGILSSFILYSIYFHRIIRFTKTGKTKDFKTYSFKENTSRFKQIYYTLSENIAFFYLLILPIMVFTTKENTAYFLSYFDKNLNKVLPQKSYATDCSININTLHNAMDIFVVAHALGWFVKALIIKDEILLHILSVLFEILEYTFEHQLPNFKECWWDHWILDVAICNTLGIYVGLYVIKKYFHYEIKENNDNGNSDGNGDKSYNRNDNNNNHNTNDNDKDINDNINDNTNDNTNDNNIIITTNKHITTKTINRTISNKMNIELTKDNCYIFIKKYNNLREYILLILFSFIWMSAELNTFYLKYLLFIPEDHPLVLMRLMIVTISAYPAVEQFYFNIYIRNKIDGNVLQYNHLKILVSIIVLEGLICYKYSEGIFKNSMPLFYKIMWMIISLVLVCIGIYKFIQDRNNRINECNKTESGIQERNVNNNVIADRTIDNDCY